MAKRKKTTRFSIEGWDNKHYQQTNAYAQAIDALFDAATKAVAQATARGTHDPNKPFTFDAYPKVKQVVQDETKKLASRMQAVIEHGSEKQWLYANKKNSAFINSIMDTSKLKRAQLNKMQDKNLDALEAFQQRKVNGLDLSQRVWKYVGQYKEQLQDALDVGIGTGKSAQALARDVKQCLNEPNMLFRRVRDKNGNLHLSKRAAAYHPGAGVYRSSVKNAQRLTRSEINMAYREADWQRWQTLDFVVGFEIKRSNHDPLCKCDLCEKLKGVYPKSFKFKGWHPQCMCYAIPVLMDEETFNDNQVGDLKAALKSCTYQHKRAKNEVIKMPKGFTEWVESNAKKQANWGSTPYFIKDNFTDGQLSKGLVFDIVPVGEQVQQAVKTTQPVRFQDLSQQEQQEWQNKWRALSNEYDAMENALLYYGVDTHAIEGYINKALFVHRSNREYWAYNDAVVEMQRVKAALQSSINNAQVKARAVIDKLKIGINDAAAWVDCNKWHSNLQRAENAYNAQASSKYPLYLGIINNPEYSHDFGAEIADIKTQLQRAINDAKVILNAPNGRDITTLQRYTNATPSTALPAFAIVQGIRNELTRLISTPLTKLTQAVKAKGVSFRDVKNLATAQTTEQIIARVGGGDNTAGSCSSLAFAYVANKSGMDVLDYRDGDSRKFFANSLNVSEIISKAGGDVVTSTTGIEMMKTAEIGKEYYLAIWAHAAIVRRTGKAQYEYLELQSPTNNGWKTLNAKVFGWRFGQRQRCTGRMIEVGKLGGTQGYRELMGYINTAEDKQAKSATGTIK